MAQHPRAKTIDWKGLPEVAAIALAGLVVLAASARQDTARPSCPALASPAVRQAEVPPARSSEEEAVLRDMRLHD